VTVRHVGRAGPGFLPVGRAGLEAGTRLEVRFLCMYRLRSWAYRGCTRNHSFVVYAVRLLAIMSKAA
jgi:hypothetical protein